MKKTKILCCLLFCVSTLFAQNIKRPQSYNFTRGVEAAKAENFKEAMAFLNKEVEENAKNGYAYLWMATIYRYYNDYGRALSHCDLALKYIPKKDKDYRFYTYECLFETYKAIEEYEKAIDAISMAIAASPENTQGYENRAQLYFEQEQYDLSNRDYQKMIDLEPGGVMGHMGIGRNLKSQKKYDEAIARFNYVIKLSDNYSSVYSFRGECYMRQGKFSEAATDIVKALVIDHDRKAFIEMQDLADSSIVAISTKLKVQASKSPNESVWQYYLGVLYEHIKSYDRAIDYYKQAYHIDANPAFAERLADCYSELGKYNEALEYIDIALLADSTDEDCIRSKAGICDALGNSAGAIAEWDRYISLEPEWYGGYYGRGWVKDHSGDFDGALEDYTMAIELKPSYPYAYVNRGVLYKLIGQPQLAQKDFEKALSLDTLRENSETIYALFHLGRVAEAKQLIQKLLAEDEDESNCYEAACLYSLAGDVDSALMYLRRSFEKGRRNFNHVRRDRDLKNVRETKQFEALMAEFENNRDQDVALVHPDVSNNGEERNVEIPFTKENGVCKVRCQINGLPLYFIFDTGASDVSISSVEATFMMKNGYLSPSDIVGKQNYLNANGEVSEGTVIVIRKVDFGGLELSNIKASVVKSQSAPLLLGQSILSRLGKIEIDNAAKVIKVTHKGAM